MYFVLPDEGLTPNDLLSNPHALSFMLSLNGWTDQKRMSVHLSLPKFDVSSQMNLKDGMEHLGAKECFSPAVADFSSLLSDGRGAYVSDVLHGSRVSIDEEGVLAAAYTAIIVPGTPAPPSDEIYFTLDRPFLFLITTGSGLPLFVGTVYNP
jgi:serine protease inhibitor